MLSLEATLNRVERLGRSGAAGDVRALVRLLGSTDWQTRRAAAEALSTLLKSHAVGLDEDALFLELIAAIDDKTDAGRRAAALAALEGTGARALPALSRALQDADASLYTALAGLIGQAGGEEAVEMLAPLVRSRDTNVAASALAALGRTRHSAATAILIEALSSEDEWLRFSAVGALGELGDATAVPQLELLLAEPLMEEAVATALEEIASVEAMRALAGNLRDGEGQIRTRVLAALVSLSEAERPLPFALQERLRRLAQRTFREEADQTTFSDVLRMTTTSDPLLRRASITALGWLGTERAIPVITDALADPAFARPARRALRDLAEDAEALQRLLEAGPDLVPPAEVAAAINGIRNYQAIEAAARLSVEAADAETLEAALAALAHGREHLREEHAERLDRERAAKLAESLRAILSQAQGRALVEIAETLGVLAPALPPAAVDTIANDLLQTGGDDHLLARLAFLDNADPLRAINEAALAQRHPSARVRLSAIEILSWRAASPDDASLALHLTDEAAGVRRAAMRAMRRGAAGAEALRAVSASLADEDIWVRAEAITTLGALFGAETEERARLREALSAPHPLCRVAAAEALARHADQKDWRALAQTARRDSQPEARRAAVLAFAYCKQSRNILSVARTALHDAAWPVRRAAVRVLGNVGDATAQKLLVGVGRDEKEEAAVRGAAVRVLANLDATQAVELACQFLSGGDEHDPTLIEDAYAALVSMRGAHEELMRSRSATCAPRAASVIKFILESDEYE